MSRRTSLALLMGGLASILPLSSAWAGSGLTFRQVEQGPVLRGRVDGLDLVRDASGWQAWFGVAGRGVQSARSSDLAHWTMEAGLRIEGSTVSHPSVVEAGALRWLFVAVAATDGTSAIHAARSTDGGLAWEHRGPVIGGRPEAPSALAADGWARADGSLGLLVVARRPSAQGTGLYLASSADGTTWTLEESQLLRGASEVTVARVSASRLVAIGVSGATYTLLASVDDGRTWTAGPTLAFAEPRGGSIRPPVGSVSMTADAAGKLQLLLATEMGLLHFQSSDAAAVIAAWQPGPVSGGVAVDALPAPPAAPTGAALRIEAPAAVDPPATRDERARPVPGAAGGPPGGERGPPPRGGMSPPPDGGLMKVAPSSQVGTVLPADIPRVWIRSPGHDVLGNNFVAGEVARGPDGRRRMYYAANGGIGSAVYHWLRGWVPEDGLRLGKGGSEEEKRGVAGHPTAIWASADTLRMYYQLSIPGEEGPPVGLYSAVSHDGVSFEREGLRIGIDEGSAFSGVGHGRAWHRKDGSIGLIFSGNLAGIDGPADLYLATTKDGLAFEARTTPIFVNGHDPSIIRLPDERLIMTFQHLLDPFRVSSSTDDGETWSPAAPLELREENGEPYPTSGTKKAEDVVWELHADGRLMMWVNCRGRGLCAFRPEESAEARKARAK